MSDSWVRSQTKTASHRDEVLISRQSHPTAPLTDPNRLFVAYCQSNTMHVLLYVVDSLRADHLSTYGYSRETTPVVDSIGGDGIVFERCYTPATWTRSVASSIVTGRFPPTHQVELRDDTLPADLPTLAERFSGAGFDTACVTGMGNVSSSTGFGRGFDDMIEVYKKPEVLDKRELSSTEEEALHHESNDVVAYPRAEDLHHYLLEWLRDRREEDTFSLVWGIDPHDPYDPPKGADWFLEAPHDGWGRTREHLLEASSEVEFSRLRDLYDCCIRYWDREIGRLIDQFEEEGLYNDLVMAVVGDHGESFGERTNYGKPSFGHGNPPYEEQMRVPFILRTPERVSPDTDSESGQRRTQLVSLVDVGATLLDVAGCEFSDLDPVVGGVSQRPQTAGRDAVFARTRIESSRAMSAGVRTVDEKYIRITPPPVSVASLREHPLHFFRLRLQTDREQLYDLTSDPDETKNVAESVTDERKRLRKQLEKWEKRCESIETDRPGRLNDEQTERQLEALGYR